MSIFFLLAGSLIGLIIVMPIQSHFDPDGGFGNFTDFQIIKLQTEKKDGKDPDSSYLWAYLVFTYVFTILLSFYLVKQSRIVSKRRQQYLGSQSSLADRTIKVSGIPHELRDEEKLREFVEKLQIGEVSSVTICRDWREIDQLADQRAKVLRKLEEAYVVFQGTRIERDLHTLLIVQPPPDDDARENQPLINGHRKPRRRRPKIRTGPWGLMGKEFDAIDYYTVKLQELDRTILEAREKIYPATPMAFVTFDKVASAVYSFRVTFLTRIATRRPVVIGSNATSISSSFSACS
jgi:calcium permeable stress-gated cation channel